MTERRSGACNEKELLQQITDLVERREIYHVKIAAANVVNEKITENLERICKERQADKLKIGALKQRNKDLNRANVHVACHKYRITSDLKRKDSVFKQFLKLGNLPSNLNAQIVQSKAFKENFLQRRAEMPWLPEKKRAREQLKYNQQEAAKIKKEIQEVDTFIEKLNQALAQHKKWPYTKFCITLATYIHRSKQMARLMSKELKLKQELDEKCKLLMQQDDLPTSAIEENDTEVNENAPVLNGSMQHEKSIEENPTEINENAPVLNGSMQHEKSIEENATEINENAPVLNGSMQREKCKLLMQQDDLLTSAIEENATEINENASVLNGSMQHEDNLFGLFSGATNAASNMQHEDDLFGLFSGATNAASNTSFNLGAIMGFSFQTDEDVNKASGSGKNISNPLAGLGFNFDSPIFDNGSSNNAPNNKNNDSFPFQFNFS